MADSGLILLTGINGFCASRLYRYLKEKMPVLGLSHNDLDIQDREACIKAAREYKPLAIIHSAAISRMDVCEKDPVLSFRVNVEGAENLAIACRETGARLIHFSTDQVYNGTSEAGPHREDIPLAPKNVYGKHKKEAEERIAAATDNYAAIRLTWMYDFHVRGLFTSQNLITKCQQAIYTGEPLTLPSRSGRGITYVQEVIENIPGLLHVPAGVYNFGSCSEISTFEAARAVFTYLGAKDRIKELLRPEEEEKGKYPDLRMDCAKAEEQGLHFSTTEEGIRRAFTEYGFMK